MKLVDLDAMPAGKEKDEIVNGLSDADFDRYDKYIDTKKNVANQEGKAIDKRIQVARQAVQEKKAEGTELDKQLIAEYTKYVHNARLVPPNKINKAFIQEIIANPITPDNIRKDAQKLLAS